MSDTFLAERRKVTAARRRGPGRPEVRVFPADCDGSHGPQKAPRPNELRLETTHPDGRIVSWFEDDWWLETLKRWKDRSLTIHFLPTPDALLHPIVLHELEMLRRLQTPWRIIGHCYLSDIGHALLLPRVAVTHYDEIHVMDGDRPESKAFNLRPPKLTCEEVFDRVREIQAAEEVSRPLLTRAPKPRP